MRVVFFSFGILEQGGGFENFLISTVGGLKKAHPDLDLTIVTMSDRVTQKLQSILTFYYFKKQSVESLYREDVEDIKRNLNGANYVKLDSISQIKKELQKYDVVHTKNEIIELLIMSMIGFKKLPPVVTGIHTPYLYPHTPSIQAKLHNLLYSLLYKVVIRKLSSVYVQNDDDYKLINAIKHNDLFKIDQALDVTPREVIKNDSKIFRMLFVGRLSEQKGLDILLNCIEKLSSNDEFKNFEFKIVGTGEPSLIQEINAACGRYKNLQFIGHVAHEDIGSLYEWTDLTLVPSRYETLCKVAIETGMYGKVAVVSDITGPREVVKNGVTGYLIPLSASDFAEKILELYQLKTRKPDEFYNLGLNAQDYLTKKFEPTKAYEEFLKILKKAYVGSQVATTVSEREQMPRALEEND